MDGMAREIMTGQPSAAPGEMGRRDIAITDAIYAAVASGKRVEVRVRLIPDAGSALIGPARGTGG